MDDMVAVVIGAIAIVGIIAMFFFSNKNTTASTPVTIEYDISGNPVRLREIK